MEVSSFQALIRRLSPERTRAGRGRRCERECCSGGKGERRVEKVLGAFTSKYQWRYSRGMRRRSGRLGGAGLRMIDRRTGFHVERKS
jgi:hypothetical protein